MELYYSSVVDFNSNHKTNKQGNKKWKSITVMEHIEFDPQNIEDECDLEILSILAKCTNPNDLFICDGNEQVVYRDIADEFIEEHVVHM